MTGFISNAPNPMSAMTVASLQDLGYTTNALAASAYMLTTTGSQAGSMTSMARPSKSARHATGLIARATVGRCVSGVHRGTRAALRSCPDSGRSHRSGDGRCRGIHSYRHGIKIGLRQQAGRPNQTTDSPRRRRAHRIKGDKGMMGIWGYARPILTSSTPNHFSLAYSASAVSPSRSSIAFVDLCVETAEGL